MADRQRDDHRSTDYRSARNGQSAIRPLRKGREGPLDLSRILLLTAHVDGPHFDAQRWGDRLDRAKLTRPGSRREVAKHRRTPDAGSDLLEQFQPFRANTVLKVGEPGGVAARMRQVVNETATDRIGDLHEYDRDTTGSLQHS